MFFRHVNAEFLHIMSLKVQNPGLTPPHCNSKTYHFRKTLHRLLNTQDLQTPHRQNGSMWHPVSAQQDFIHSDVIQTELQHG